jgi:hypothetical protein
VLARAEVSGTGLRVPLELFVALEDDARLEFLYRTMVMIGALRRSDRPAHRFFAPLLASRAGGQGGAALETRTGTVLSGRGIVVRIRRGILHVERNCPAD